MEELLAVIKCANFALSCKKYLDNRDVKTLIEANMGTITDKLDCLNTKLDAYTASDLNMALSFVQLSSTSNAENSNFYLDQAYLHFTRAAVFYKNLADSYYQSAISELYNGNEKGEDIFNKIPFNELGASYLGCYMCACHKNDLSNAILFLDNSIGYCIDFYPIRITCSFSQKIPKIPGFELMQALTANCCNRLVISKKGVIEQIVEVLCEHQIPSENYRFTLFILKNSTFFEELNITDWNQLSPSDFEQVHSAMQNI